MTRLPKPPGLAPAQQHCSTTPKPVVGLSACLNGEAVRINGDSKRHQPQLSDLHEVLELRSHCPEIAIGLGAPREALRLVGSAANPRLMDSKSQSRDYSDAMRTRAGAFLDQHPELAGYILVRGSPSCGLERVKRYNDQAQLVGRDGQGLFSAALANRDPLLPLEEDGRLHDATLRENFITRVYAYADWKHFITTEPGHHALCQFWARYKYLLMAHDPERYRCIGRLLANARASDPASVRTEFIALLMQGLGRHASRGSRTNVLQHIRGYLKKALSGDDKQELDHLIHQYRQGIVPLIVPITVLKHHFRRFPDAYIAMQVFMQPYPEQLKLRNHL